MFHNRKNFNSSSGVVGLHSGFSPWPNTRIHMAKNRFQKLKISISIPVNYTITNSFLLRLHSTHDVVQGFSTPLLEGHRPAELSFNIYSNQGLRYYLQTTSRGKAKLWDSGPPGSMMNNPDVKNRRTECDAFL